MSVSLASSLLPYAEIGQLGQRALGLSAQSTALTAQSASGLLTSNVADLGAATGTVLELQPQLSALAGWTGNITAAGNRLSVAQTALTSIGTLASSLSTTLLGLSGEQGDDLATGIQSAASEAKSALGQLGTLLDTSSGDAYVFAGTDLTDAPIADSASLTSGSLFASIATAVSSLSSSGATTTMSSILSLAGSTAAGAPFAASLSTDPVTASSQNAEMRVGSQTTVTVGFAATSGSAPTAASTGSPIRDLVAALSTVANLTEASASVGGFTDLVSSLRSLTTGASTTLADMQGAMGATQDTLATMQTSYADASSALSSQLSSLTTVDLASVSTQLTATNAQLQASYELISDLKGLSLADYL